MQRDGASTVSRDIAVNHSHPVYRTENGAANPFPPTGTALRSTFEEEKFYRFGLHLGIENFRKNGLALGIRKTLGKITQPINSYTRFPEYAFMEESIRSFCDSRMNPLPAEILDVGSPKCFGLFLAAKQSCNVEMTDISPLNLDEYRTMWDSVRGRAKGHVGFSLQDARALTYPEHFFDIVYSMSVIEHVSGEEGDSEALRQMVRVLRPGGLLLFSVPFGSVYTEQWRKDFAGAVEEKNDGTFHFFQRIYDARTLQTRLLMALKNVDICSTWTVWRRSNLLVKALARLGQNLRGALGVINPVLSSNLNYCAPGIVEGIPTSYGEIHSPEDLCGDVIIAGRKCS
jgi:2-polyprenyl-3-methyl-5-hydroxy-6-metoxy-1,4-benzoquinol methylase